MPFLTREDRFDGVEISRKQRRKRHEQKVNKDFPDFLKDSEKSYVFIRRQLHLGSGLCQCREEDGVARGVQSDCYAEQVGFSE